MKAHDKYITDWTKQRKRVDKAIKQNNSRLATGELFILELLADSTKRKNIIKSFTKVIALL